MIYILTSVCMSRKKTKLIFSGTRKYLEHIGEVKLMNGDPPYLEIQRAQKNRGCTSAQCHGSV